jgi:hypothetical protein
LLFVIDNDFGALGTVMYLLHRQPIAADSILLLPRRAHELHAAGLAHASRPYESLQDILDVVESESPGVVFLFSGYLIAAQHLLTIGSLAKLVRALEGRGCKVATSDPYLGTFRRVAAAAIPPRASAARGLLGRWRANFMHRMRLERHVRKVADLLEGVAHVYPVAADSLGQGGGVQRVAFYNPLYIRTGEELREISTAVSALPSESAGVRRWLFVLAQFDLEFQEKKYGRQGFVGILERRIRDALDAGRHAAFIGPATVTQALATRLGGASGVTLLNYCAFAEFERRMLDAEMVFHWHVHSTSAFLRLWNGLPIFFFDQGHVPRLFAPLHEAGLKHYYMGARPIVLDVEQPLEERRLAQLGAGFGPAAVEARARLARLPGPAEMVDAIRRSPG